MKRENRFETIMYGIVSNAEIQNLPKSRPISWKEYNFDTEKGFRFMANVTTVVRMFEPLPDEVSAGEIGMLLKCTKYLESESNMLFYRSDCTHNAMSVIKLAEKLNKSTRHVQRFVAKMCKLHVLAREQKRLYVNPCYFFRGRYLNYHLYSLFRPELQAVLPAWVVDKFETMRQN